MPERVSQDAQRTSTLRTYLIKAVGYPFDRLLDWFFGKDASHDKALRLAIMTLLSLVSCPFAAFIIPSMVTTGTTKSADGIIVYRGPYHRNPSACEIDILYEKSQSIKDFDFASDNKHYCGPDYAAGSTVTFEYKTNLFGKAVLGPHPIVRPISKQPPPPQPAPEKPADRPGSPMRLHFLPNAAGTPFDQESGSHRP